MSVDAVENLPRKWYTGDVLINNKRDCCLFCNQLSKRGKIILPRFVFQGREVYEEKFCFKSEAGDKDGI